MDGGLCFPVYVSFNLGTRSVITHHFLFFSGYFPRLVLVLPQVITVTIILVTYKYPDVFVPSSAPDNYGDSATTAPPPAEASTIAEWQANIQAIQNLMGFYADAYNLVTPYTKHLSANFKSPYTPHILALLVLSIPPTIFLIHMPIFPLRQMAIVAGTVPLLCTNPAIQPWLLHTVNLVQSRQFASAMQSFLSFLSSFPALKLLIGDTLAGTSSGTQITSNRIKSTVQNVIDNANLPDRCWASPMRQVELFENERLDPASAVTDAIHAIDRGGPSTSGDTNSSNRSQPFTTGKGKGWSKTHLRPDERHAWTKWRDGSSSGSIAVT
jgi:hypothetical protein